MVPPVLAHRRLAPAIVLALGIAWSQAAGAQPPTPADKAALAQGLYDSAAELIKAGKLAEACPKLEESQRLDPAMGTQFFLAGCYEKTGRPTSAWSLFLEVAAAAKAAGNSVRENTARSRAAALEPKLPRLRVVLTDATAATPGLEVLRDGTALKQVAWGAPIPVDLGDHTIRVHAPGKAPWETKVSIQEGQKLDVTVPPLTDAPTVETPPTPPPVPPPQPPVEPVKDKDKDKDKQAATFELGGQRVGAIVAGTAGIAGLAVGAALGVMAKSAWSQATTECPSQLACSSDAHDQSARAVSLGTGSTVAFVVGGAALVGGVVLWFTAPSPKAASAWIRVVPSAARGGGGVLLTGAF